MKTSKYTDKIITTSSGIQHVREVIVTTDDEGNEISRHYHRYCITPVTVSEQKKNELITKLNEREVILKAKIEARKV